MGVPRPVGGIRPIGADEIVRDRSSYVDPHGFLFHHDGGIYRCIHSHAAPFYRSLLDDGTVAELQSRNYLVPTRPVDLEIEGQPDALILEHERIWPLSYCVEWCPAMLRDAGRITLDLALALVDRDLMLQDAYPWNVLFAGSQPVFVDLTSIAPADRRLLWPAAEQFEAFFFRPLVLACQGKGSVARALLFDNIGGIALEDFYCLLTPFYRMRHPGVLAVHWLDRRLQRSRSAKERARLLAERAIQGSPPSVRRRFLERLSRRLGSLADRPAEDPWTRYYADMGSHVDKAAKLRGVNQLLDRLDFETVLDLGCNTGVFSIEAARRGIQVVSLDSSESCIENLYDAARRENLKITPLVTDVLCPTPPFGFMGRQYPGLCERVRSDVVLCLGLMHHLHLTGRQSLDRIAEMLATVTRRALIFEFVGRDDDNIHHLPERRVIDYTLDTVRASLAEYFSQIEVLPSDRPTRHLLLCTR